MAQNDRGTISLIKSATPDLTLSGIQDVGLSPNLEQLVRGGDGQVDPTFSAVMTGAPSLTFSTLAIATALGAFGIDGTEVTTLDAYLQAIAAYGTRKGAVSHLKMSAAKALVVPRTINAAHGPEPATIALEALPISSDGQTVPISLTASQSIPAGAGVAEAYTLGPVKINGTAIDVANLTLDFGLDVRTEGSEGDVWPKLGYVMNRSPVIRITTPHRVALLDFGLAGTEQGATDSLVYLRKLDKGGTRVAEALEQHVSIAVDDGRIHCESVVGAQGERLGTEVVIVPVFDGTAAILAIDTTAAIT